MDELTEEATAPTYHHTIDHDPTTQRMTARIFARHARDRIRNLTNPAPEDYRIAAHCMRLARQTLDDDVELLRQEIEAWSAAGNAKEALDATRELIRLDPEDTVAQLRYIAAQVDRQQTVEERLATAERFLGPKGRRLDPSVRSRIAFDAALLARELGNEDQFLDLLQLASTLDVTNKQAATLFATYYLDRVDDPHDRVDLLLNVVLADPLDISALENLARELVRLGAFAGAMRFYDRMRDIMQTSDDDLDTDQLTEYFICVWNTRGHKDMLDIMAELDRTRLAPYLRYREMQRRDDIEPGAFLEPVHPLEIEETRLCALVGLGDRAADAAFTKRPEEADLIFRRPADAPTIPKPTLIALARCQQSIEIARVGVESTKFREQIEASGRDINKWYAEIALHRLWTRLIVGCELDEAAKDLDDLARGLVGINIEERAINRYRGWLAGLQGDADTARTLLEPLIDQDDQALWALAVTEERAGLPMIAAEHFAALANRRSYTALGTAARERASQLFGKPLEREHLAKELDEMALRVAPWFERMTAEPRTFMQLDLKIDPLVASPVDAPVLEVTLKNVSPTTLGVGSSAAISSRLLLTPRLIIDTTEIPAGLRPLLEVMQLRAGARPDQATQRVTKEIRDLGAKMLEVLDFDRRLRLERNQAITVRIPATTGIVERLLFDDVSKRATLAWRATQGFIPGEEGFIPGPLCLSTQSPTLIITALGSDVTPEQAIEIFRQPQITLQELLIATSKFKRLSIEQAVDAGASEGDLFNEMAGACRAAIANLNEQQRTLFMLRLGDLAIPQIPDREGFVRDAVNAVRDAPTSIGLAYGTFGAGSLDNEMLLAALASDNPETAAIAQIRRDQIEAALAARDAANAAPTP